MNDKMIEYDKRIGVPKFEGWQEREIEAQSKCLNTTYDSNGNCTECGVHHRKHNNTTQKLA